MYDTMIKKKMYSFFSRSYGKPHIDKKIYGDQNPCMKCIGNSKKNIEQTHMIINVCMANATNCYILTQMSVEVVKK